MMVFCQESLWAGRMKVPQAHWNVMIFLLLSALYVNRLRLLVLPRAHNVSWYCRPFAD